MICDFKSTTKHLGRQVYSVAIAVDRTIYWYASFALNHFLACEEAIANHQKYGFPLPAGTRCGVSGPCQDLDCVCKKPRVKVYIWSGPLRLEGLTN
jgi:hypothetical protein